MKKLFFLLAVAGLTSFAACKSGETKVEATTEDTTVQVEAAVDSVAAPVDSVAVPK